MADVFLETPRFPDCISYGSTGGPGYMTDITPLKSGYEQRNVSWTQSRHSYNVAMGVKTYPQLSELSTFHHAMMGSAFGFRYKDWGDYMSCDLGQTPTEMDQEIGVGNGSSTVFQLIKNYTEGVLTTTRKIQKPVDLTLMIAIDGITTTAFTVDNTTGLITFTTAPGNSLVITAGYEFDVPCRFGSDNLETNFDAFATGSVNIPIMEIRI